MRRREFRFRCFGWLLLLGAGCQAFSAHHPVLVQIRDAETQRPLEGAAVHLTYPRSPNGGTPNRASAKSDARGIAALDAVEFGETMVVLEAGADGYLGKSQEMACSMIRQTAPAGWFEDIRKRPTTMTLDLYAGPRPTVEFILPAGFRGMFKAEVKADAAASCSPGQRLFRSDVPAVGVTIPIIGPPLLTCSGPPTFAARYSDGQALRERPQGLEIGFWWLKGEDGCEYFLVGTDQEYATWRQSEVRPDRGVRPAGGNSGGGGGRGHGRRGGKGG